MKSKLAIALLLLTGTLVGPGCTSIPRKQPSPLAGTSAEAIAGTRRLYDKIVGTVWLHRYQDHDFEFEFGRSGTIERHENWKGTKWRVVSPTEIICEGVTGAKMVFTFDDAAITFTNIDWDGTPTTGIKKPR